MCVCVSSECGVLTSRLVVCSDTGALVHEGNTVSMESKSTQVANCGSDISIYFRLLMQKQL